MGEALPRPPQSVPPSAPPRREPSFPLARRLVEAPIAPGVPSPSAVRRTMPITARARPDPARPERHDVTSPGMPTPNAPAPPPTGTPPSEANPVDDGRLTAPRSPVSLGTPVVEPPPGAALPDVTVPDAAAVVPARGAAAPPDVTVPDAAAVVVPSRDRRAAAVAHNLTAPQTAVPLAAAPGDVPNPPDSLGAPTSVPPAAVPLVHSSVPAAASYGAAPHPPASPTGGMADLTAVEPSAPRAAAGPAGVTAAGRSHPDAPTAALSQPAAAMSPAAMSTTGFASPEDTGQAMQASVDLGTDGGRAAFSRRQGQWWASFVAAWVLVVGVGGGLAWGLGPDLDAAASDGPGHDASAQGDGPSEAASDEGGSRSAMPTPHLWELARVNETDLTRASPYEERHRLIAVLDGTQEASRVDRRLNLALDLLQATATDDPCRVFAGALARIEAAGDPYYEDALRRAAAPGGSAGCAGLEARRKAALDGLADASATPDGPVASAAPDGESATGKADHARKRGGKKAGRKAKKPKPPPPEPEPQPKSGKKLSGDELRPFGGG